MIIFLLETEKEELPNLYLDLQGLIIFLISLEVDYKEPNSFEEALNSDEKLVTYNNEE